MDVVTWSFCTSGSWVTTKIGVTYPGPVLHADDLRLYLRRYRGVQRNGFFVIRPPSDAWMELSKAAPTYRTLRECIESATSFAIMPDETCFLLGCWLWGHDQPDLGRALLSAIATDVTVIGRFASAMLAAWPAHEGIGG